MLISYARPHQSDLNGTHFSLEDIRIVEVAVSLLPLPCMSPFNFTLYRTDERISLCTF